MNLLLTTLGSSWAIIPELLAFTNPDQVRLFENHPESVTFEGWRAKHSIQPVNEVWVVTTAGERIKKPLQDLHEWHSQDSSLPILRIFRSPGVTELGSIQECRWMRDLIFRLALHARREAQATNGSFLMSLAGGRKTMSADAQLSYELFGGDALLHVVDLGQLPESLRNASPSLYHQPLDAETAKLFSPIIVRGPQSGNPILRLPEAAIDPFSFPIPNRRPNPEINEIPDSSAFADKVEATLSEAHHLMLNFTEKLLQQEGASNFRALYTLPPDTIGFLQRDRIGHLPRERETHLAWLQSLPKAELHCHLGGILNEADTIAVAQSIAPAIENTARSHQQFRQLRDQFRSWRRLSVDDISIKLGKTGWKSMRDQCGKPLRDQLTASFILEALEDPHRLADFLFGNWLIRPETFHGIGIAAYEKLGDLQGSSLLQSPEALATAADCLKRMCAQENIRYCEVRCSPLNCIHGGMTPLSFIQNLRVYLKSPDTIFRLIFIASRHGDNKAIQGHVSLVSEWQQQDPEGFREGFAGFDLAGNEEAASPGTLRGFFQPIRKNCLQMTIHAGEGKSPENIWEATHELNAERIGHGLTLGHRPDLIDFLRRRRVTIEMCPSSNDQIVGFRSFSDPLRSSPEFPPYPLENYLREGLRVCLNTDDPGMSRTTLSQEFLKAAQMLPHGLTRWEIYHLIRNSFQAAFAPSKIRQDLILKAERDILQQIVNP